MRIRALLIAVVAVIGAACSKGGAGGSGKLEGASAIAPSVLPKDASMIFGINLEKVRKNKYFQNLVKTIPAENLAVFDALKSTCSIDALTDVQSIVVAGGGADMDRSRVSILIKGNWSEAKLADCASKFSYQGKKATVAKEGDLTTYTVEGRPPVAVAWVAKDTILTTAGSLEGDKTYLADLLKQKSALADNKPMTDLMAKTNTDSTFWLAAMPVGPAALMSQKLGAALNAKVLALYVSIDYIADLKVNGGATIDSDAKAAADKLNHDLDNLKKQPQAGDFFKDTTIAAKGSDVTLSVAMSEQQVDQLVEMIKGFLPMVLGGMIQK